jgi:hypothetical protein
VRNRTGRIEIRIQGNPAALQAFACRLFQQAPPLAEPGLKTGFLPVFRTTTIRRCPCGGAVRPSGPGKTRNIDA